MSKESHTPKEGYHLEDKTVIVKKIAGDKISYISGLANIDGIPLYICADTTWSKPTENEGRLYHRPAAPLAGKYFDETPLYAFRYQSEKADFPELTEARDKFVLSTLGYDTTDASDSDIRHALKRFASSETILEKYSDFYKRMDDPAEHEKIMSSVRKSLHQIYEDYLNS